MTGYHGVNLWTAPMSSSISPLHSTPDELQVDHISQWRCPEFSMYIYPDYLASANQIFTPKSNLPLSVYVKVKKNNPPNMFLIAFFLEIAAPVTSSRLVIWCWRCCYFNTDSTEVTTGFLAVTPVPHLNRPPPGGKTGGRFICNWRDCETKKGRKRSGEIRSDGRSGNSRHVFVWFQTTQQQPHPVRNS